MSEAPLMNDDAARSSTGEILDQSTPPTPSTTPSTSSTSTEPPTSTTTTPTEGDKAPLAATSAAPEAYADFKVPEGYTLDKDFLASATATLRELGLSQDAAQKLIDLQVQREIAAAKAPEATYAKLRSDWQAAVLADADIKGYSTDGRTGIDAVKVDIGRALGSLGDLQLVSDFKAAMDLTGAGDNPAFVKTLWRLAQRIGEGKPVAGAGPSPAGQRAPGTSERPSAAQAMYPNLK